MRLDFSLLLVAVVGAILGCRGDTATAIAPSVASTYFSLVLNEHAINMAVTDPLNHSNSMQLTVAAFDLAGDPISIPDRATFQATDSSVTVSAEGLVTAHYPTTVGGTQVIATLQIGNVTHRDTAFIRVTATAPAARIQTFSIQPVGGDSAVRSIATQYIPTVTATTNVDSVHMSFDSHTVNNKLFYWLGSGDPSRAPVGRDARSVIGNDSGHVTLYATSWVYGISVRDSLKFLIGWPLVQVVIVNGPADVFGNRKVFLGVGGWMEWANVSTDSVGIVFDDSTAIDSAMDDILGAFSGPGNVYLSPYFDAKARAFPLAGSYHYHSLFDSTQTGTIYVLTNPAP